MVVLHSGDVIMADSGLGLFGSRAPSAASGRPSLGTNSNHQPVTEPGAPGWNPHKPPRKYTDRLFGQEPSQDSCRSNTSFNVKQRNYTQQRCPTPKNKGKSSYVDETLFGSARSNVSQFDDQSSWDNERKEHRPVIKDPSKTSKTRNQRPSTPNSRPGSVYGKRGYYKTTNYNSVVDDTLFAHGDNSSAKQNSAVEYDYFGNKIISKTASMKNVTSQSSRPGSRAQTATPAMGVQGTGMGGSRPGSAAGSRPGSAASSRPSSAMSSYTADRKVPFENWIRQSKSEHQKILPSKYQVFNSSYVDESLFGPKPVEADFPAPWDKPDKPKPFIFDTSNFSAQIGSKSGGGAPVVREKGPYLRKPIVKNPDAKPVWK